MTGQPYEQNGGFPNDPMFQQLIYVAQKSRGTVVHDASGFEADYARFFRDVSNLRITLRRALPRSAFKDDGLLDETYPFVTVLSTGGYEFIVAFYAILSLGGACVPLATNVLPEEAEYFMKTTTSAFLLVGNNRMSQAASIRAYVLDHTEKELMLIPIPGSEDGESRLNLSIDDQVQPSPTRAAVAMFTSGTVTRPKAVVFPRGRFYFGHKFEPDTVTLAYRPHHWIGGMRNLIQPLLHGQQVFLLPRGADNEVLWQSLRDLPLTQFAATPMKLRQLKDFFEQHLSRLPDNELNEYRRGIQRLDAITSAGALIEESTLQFWKGLLGDSPVVNIYALTETGTVTRSRPNSKVKHSIGTPIPGVSIKLSEEDHGEALVKTPKMFSQYLGDEEATRRAFDKDGYFRTGDLLRREGDEYIFEGRAMTDFVLFYTYRIPILELENSLMNLSYIAEAYVIAAPDHEARELAAAIVRPHKSSIGNDTQISLRNIRNDLSASLAMHKLPALLRVLHDGESVPHTAAGKPVKRDLLGRFFGISGFIQPDYSETSVEYWGNQIEQVSSETRPWDWCGLQNTVN